MNITWHLFLIAAFGTALSGCHGPLESEGIAREKVAYSSALPEEAASSSPVYRLTSDDVIQVRVFQEPDLSSDRIQVDETGHIQLPFAGNIPAAGLTVRELSALITERLAREFLRDPQVVVTVVSRREQVVAIEGEVKMPGVYAIGPGDTLLSVIARAQSPTKVAKLDEIVVFRMADGKRLAARFDLRAIRAGQAPDPEIRSGDIVVVGYSSLKGIYRDILQAAPLLNVFTRF